MSGRLLQTHPIVKEGGPMREHSHHRQRSDTSGTMLFCRWAQQHPEAARCVETIRATFEVNRRTACRWRRAWRATLRLDLPCATRTQEADLAQLNRGLLDGARERVRRVTSLQPTAELNAEQKQARAEAGADVIDYLRFVCGAGQPHE